MTIDIEDDDETTMKECCSWLMHRYFTKDKLYRRLPFLSWLPKYSFEDLKGDIIAGISVAFTIVPQGLALAGLAGLPAQYGLYTSFMGCFIYAIFGCCKEVAVGPTSIMAIIIAPYVAISGIPYAILLAFLAGCVQLLFGILNLGFIVDFISFPVISSFSSAAAITIAASQLKGLFGQNYHSDRFIETMKKFICHLPEINWWDFALGFACLVFLIPIQLAKDFHFQKGKKPNYCIDLLNGLWHMISTARNAIVVIVCAAIASYNIDNNVFTLTSEIEPGLPAFRLPPFRIVKNETVEKEFKDIMEDLGMGIFVVALLGLMESVAVANAFMNSTRKFDATQEMIALGFTNIFGSFFGAFPATGSFSRSAVNHNSGVRTPLGGIFTGTLVLASLSTLGSYFQFIPRTVLATIIIAAVIFMIRPYDAILIWQTNKIDILPYIATFGSCLVFGLEYGIIVGVSVSLVILLYQMARPKVFIVHRTTPDGIPFLYVKPDRSVFFPSIDYMKVKIIKELHDFIESNPRVAIVLDGEHMFRADSTFALVSHFKVFKSFLMYFIFRESKIWCQTFDSRVYLPYFIILENQFIKQSVELIFRPANFIIAIMKKKFMLSSRT